MFHFSKNKVNYPIVQKAVDYLDHHRGEKYRNPDKLTGAEKEYMSEFKREGQEAREEYRIFCQKLADSMPGLLLDSGSPSGWVNQGQIVNNYIWSRFTTERYKNFIYIIAVNVDIPEGLFDKTVLEVWVGEDEKKNNNHKKLARLLDLDITMTDNLYYVCTRLDDSRFYSTNVVDIREKWNKGLIRSVCLLKVIDGPYTAERAGDVFKATQDAVKRFIPYYEYVMDGDGPEGDWLQFAPSLKKPDNKEKIDYSGEYSVGCKVEHNRYGIGEISGYNDGKVEIEFESGESRSFDLAMCVEKRMLERV